MTDASDLLPNDLAAAHAMILAERAARWEAEAKAQAAHSSNNAFIAYLKLEIEKLRRTIYGARSEHTARLLDQLEMQLEDSEADAHEDELAAEKTLGSTLVKAFERRRPARKPFPEHLPRERVVIAAPENCPCCGSMRLSKLGEDITETLEVIPRQWKVIQTVRERFSCRQCETITQPPAPFHVTPRGFAGPNLLAMILFEKFGQHQPLNRQSERYAREDIDLSLSTLADQVGICAAILYPLFALIEAYVLAAERLHGDDTTVPILAKGKTDTGRVWVYVRDDKPFGGRSPPAALFYASRDRRGEHPERHLAAFTGILQADAYGGYNKLYLPGRRPGPVLSALCWSHGRRKFFELADIAAKPRRGQNAPVISPIALEAVKRIDVLFEIERAINGLSAEQRLAARRDRSLPLVNSLEDWLRSERVRFSHHAPIAKAMDYMLKRWSSFARFLDDGRICITNNAAERALRSLALGRKSWLFAGSDRGAGRAAIMYTLIQTAKLNDVDPQAWLADVLARINDHKIGDLAALLPWNCATDHAGRKAGGMKNARKTSTSKTSTSIARLKITLDDVEPKVVRRVEVPLTIRLDRLHLALQAALGWTNSHLYEIRAKDVGWGIPDPDWGGGPLDASKARLIDVLEDVGTKTLKYLYDFGDGWEHTIKIERIDDAIFGIDYPFLLEVKGRCPPEDIGGPPGYENFLAALADPKHEDHAEMLEWAPPDFDPHYVDKKARQRDVEQLAKRWKPKPRAPRIPKK